MKQKIREKYQQLQEIYDYAKDLKKQLEQVENQCDEISGAQDNLNQLEALDGGEDVLIPVNNGIFIKGNLQKNSGVSVNVGSGVVVEKSFKEASDMLSGNLKELMEIRDKLAQTVSDVDKRAKSLENELIELSKKAKEAN